MSRRAWYRCNRRKADALIAQGVKVRIEGGVYYYKRRIENRGKKKSGLQGPPVQ